MQRYEGTGRWLGVDSYFDSVFHYQHFADDLMLKMHWNGTLRFTLQPTCSKFSLKWCFDTAADGLKGTERRPLSFHCVRSSRRDLADALLAKW